MLMVTGFAGTRNPVAGSGVPSLPRGSKRHRAAERIPKWHAAAVASMASVSCATATRYPGHFRLSRWGP